MEVHEVLSAGLKIIAKPPKTVEKAIDALVATYIEHSLVYLSKEMWRQAIAISTQQPDSPFGKAFSTLDRELADQGLLFNAPVWSITTGSTFGSSRPDGESGRRGCLRRHTLYSL